MDADAAARRADTITRAIALIDTAPPADLAGYLAGTNIHDHLKADPAALRQRLATVDDMSPGSRFGAWKAAQQILRAAGLPY
jgi:hypothetical protein